MTTPGSLREVQIWIAVARSGGSSSEPPLSEIVAPLGSPSCQSLEPQFGQKTQRSRRPLSVSRVQAATGALHQAEISVPDDRGDAEGGGRLLAAFAAMADIEREG